MNNQHFSINSSVNSTEVYYILASSRCPEEVPPKSMWMEALVQTEWQPKLGSIISLKHLGFKDVPSTAQPSFQSDSVPLDNSRNVSDHDYSMKEGDMKMCRICFATDNMYSMTSFKVLNEAYQSLTGIKTENENHLPRYLCSDCADRLMNCARFRRRSIRAHTMLLDIAKKHGHITVDLVHSEIKMNNPFSCDSIPNPNDGLCGVNNKELEEVNILSYKKCGSNVDAHVINNIKSEIDNEIDSNEIEDEINVTVDNIKTENDAFENQQDFNTGSPRLDENIVEPNVAAENYDIFNQDNHSGCLRNLDEDIDLNDIIAHNDMINRDDVSECSFTSDDFNENSMENDKDTVNDAVASTSLSYPATLFEDIVNNVLLVVYNVVLNEDNPKAAKSISEDIEYGHSFTFVGEDVLPDCLPSQEVRLEAQRVTKTSQDLNKMSIDNQQPLDIDNEFSTDVFKCDLCSFQTSLDIELLEHLKSHANKVYQCDKCVFNTNSRRNLNFHVRGYHIGNIYLCSVCKETFQSNHKLKLHLKIHNQKTYVCDICKKNFKHKSLLRVHLKNHVEKKSYRGKRVKPCSVL